MSEHKNKTMNGEVQGEGNDSIVTEWADLKESKQVLKKEYIPSSVTSFNDLDAINKANQQLQNIVELFWNYLELADNVLYGDIRSPEETQFLLARLTSEYFNRLINLEQIKSITKSAIESLDDSQSKFMLMKDNTGNLLWGGIPTNKFIDKHNDIISEAAHKLFVKELEEGIIDYPDVYLWHIRKAVGTTEWVSYDPRGFVVAGGKIFPEYAEYVTNIIKNTDEEIGMSHGVYLKDIQRDITNPHVISKYRSHELSLLPLSEAANILTAFTSEE